VLSISGARTWPYVMVSGQYPKRQCVVSPLYGVLMSRGRGSGNCYPTPLHSKDIRHNTRLCLPVTLSRVKGFPDRNSKPFKSVDPCQYPALLFLSGIHDVVPGRKRHKAKRATGRGKSGEIISTATPVHGAAHYRSASPCEAFQARDCCCNWTASVCDSASGPDRLVARLLQPA
jgi:hypothetical protein